MRKIRVRTRYTLGDVVVLTGAIRDLHLNHPGQFRTSVECCAPAIWEHHPHVQPRTVDEEIVDLDDIEVDRTGATGLHYLEATLDLLNRKLGTSARLTELKGDIHLSRQERSWYSDIWTLCGQEVPFWIVSTGGKFDIPIKWWDSRRMQQVVDALAGKIQFVQVGTWGNQHPKIEGAIDLRGKTRVRDLIHLVHHADGVLCGVTALMHLAAAVPTRHGGPRPAVVIGGAREPASWETYPDHEFISTEREVPCGPCWKTHVPRKTAGQVRESESRDCVEPAGNLPRCMDLITPERVVERFEKLHREGRLRFLSRKWKPYAAAARATTSANTFDLHNITPLNSVARAEEFIATIPTYPSRRFSGRGIVICAGGVNYFAQAWVCIQMLRRHGCELPIQIWHLGRTELDEKMEALVRPLGVECVNARKVMNRHPMRNPLGWELKCYSILRSPFAEVISLDADNVPLIDPTELFNTPEYLRTGAIFWPDYGRLKRHRAIWKLCGIPFRDEPEFESGQMVVDKSRCWKSINLAWWYNDHSEFFYRHIHGDKETFHLAWRKIGQEYSMPPFPVRSLSGTMCQHDFEGRLIFQHRNSHKFQFFGGNVRVPGFLLEDECLDYLEQLRAKWDGRIRGKREATSTETGFSFRKHTVDRHVFESVAHGNEYALPPVLNPEDVVLDVGAHIGSFSWAAHERGSRRIHSFEPHPENFEMARKNLGGTAGITLRRAAILHCNTAVIPGDFPADGPLQNTGGGIVNVDRAGCTPAFALDEVILKLEKVTLIKLDCEGSEWPILIHSQLLDRVTALCGEYHARPSHALCPEIGRELDREFLESILRRHFRHVRCVADRKDAAVGKFWASNVKSFFGRGTRLDSSKTARIRAAAVRSASSAGGGP